MARPQNSRYGPIKPEEELRDFDIDIHVERTNPPGGKTIDIKRSGLNTPQSGTGSAPGKQRNYLGRRVT